MNSWVLIFALLAAMQFTTEAQRPQRCHFNYQPCVEECSIQNKRGGYCIGAFLTRRCICFDKTDGADDTNGKRADLSGSKSGKSFSAKSVDPNVTVADDNTPRKTSTESNILSTEKSNGSDISPTIDTVTKSIEMMKPTDSFTPQHISPVFAPTFFPPMPVSYSTDASTNLSVIREDLSGSKKSKPALPITVEPNGTVADDSSPIKASNETKTFSVVETTTPILDVRGDLSGPKMSSPTLSTAGGSHIAETNDTNSKAIREEIADHGWTDLPWPDFVATEESFMTLGSQSPANFSTDAITFSPERRADLSGSKLPNPNSSPVEDSRTTQINDEEDFAAQAWTDMSWPDPETVTEFDVPMAPEKRIDLSGSKMPNPTSSPVGDSRTTQINDEEESADQAWTEMFWPGVETVTEFDVPMAPEKRIDLSGTKMFKPATAPLVDPSIILTDEETQSKNVSVEETRNPEEFGDFAVPASGNIVAIPLAGRADLSGVKHPRPVSATTDSSIVATTESLNNDNDNNKEAILFSPEESSNIGLSSSEKTVNLIVTVPPEGRADLSGVKYPSAASTTSHDSIVPTDSPINENSNAEENTLPPEEESGDEAWAKMSWRNSASKTSTATPTMNYAGHLVDILSGRKTKSRQSSTDNEPA